MQSVQPKNGYAMTAAACVWLGLFPLLQGGTYAHITHDKWVIMLILTGVTLTCFVLDSIMFYLVRRKQTQSAQGVILSASEGSPRRGVVPLILAFLLLLWTVLSCVFSSYGPETWWLGESARYEGLLSQLCYFALFFLFFFSRIYLTPVLLSAAAGAAGFFTVVMLQRAGGNPLGLYPAGRSFFTNYEFQGTIGNIDMDTGYLLLVSGLLLYGLLRPVWERGKAVRAVQPAEDRPKGSVSPWKCLCLVLYSLAFVLAVWLIVIMDVQFGMIGLAALLLFTVLRFLPRKLRLSLLILLIVLALLAVWFWPGHSGGIWELHEILHGRGRLSFGSNRVAVWTYSFRLAGENLLLGGGSGTFRARFNRFLTENNLVIPKEQDGVPLPDYFDNAHNEYVGQLTDHGLPAVLLFLALILVSLFRRREGWFPCLSSCSAAVLCYAVQAFFSFSVCLVAPMFWVVLGLSFRE